VKQQINLYQPIFRKQKIVFSAQTIVWLSIGFLIILVAWSQLIGQRIASLESELDRQLAAEQRAIDQVAALQRSMPSDQPDPELETRLLELEQQRHGLQQTLLALEGRMPLADAALHARLDELARRVPRGLWLTGITLEAGGTGLTLHGRALSARLVPEYLDALGDSPLLEGTALRTVRVTAADDDRPGVRFTLSTREEDDR
jgi:Tfp pilus assembly protein PilN